METEIVIQIVTMVVFAIICAIVARSRGRSPIAWFFIGGLFGCFALIVLFVTQDLKVEEERRRRREKQIERLSERQRKDRATMDRQLEAQNRRLTAHDQAIGVDTAQADSPAALPAPPRRRGKSNGHREAEWFFAVDEETDEEFGPVTFEDLRQAFLSGEIGHTSLVWNDAMPDWVTIDKVPGLLDELEGPA